MNLCIYVFISFKGKTHVVFLFQICFHLIDRLRNTLKKHSDIIYTIIYYTIVYYSILYCIIVDYSIHYYSISNIRIQQRLLANYIPGATHNLQRSTGYQFSSVRYYILSYDQKYISGYGFNHLSHMTQK